MISTAPSPATIVIRERGPMPVTGSSIRIGAAAWAGVGSCAGTPTATTPYTNPAIAIAPASISAANRSRASSISAPASCDTG